MGSPVTIGRYRVVRSLGRGGMGEVFLALAQGPAGFEKLVALKLLAAGGDAVRAQSLIREANIGGRLDHENLVQIFDFGQELERYYVAMEYVRGYSLGHVLSHLNRIGRRLPGFAVARVIRAVVDALEYMHGLARSDGRPLGLVHGDISPSNILLSVDGRIKLADFGVAAVGDDTGAPLAGKLAYLPPEALCGDARSQRWDLFALGAVLYEALAGRRAFLGGSMDEIASAMERGAQALDVAPALRGLADLAQQMIAREPGERPASARAVLDALRRAASSSADERDLYRAYLAQLFAEPAFVDQHGDLPSTTGLPSRVANSDVDEKTEQVTFAVKSARGLRFGLTSAHGSERARRLGALLCERLALRLGRTVRTVVMADYQSLIDTVAGGDVDFAWMPPLAFVGACDRGAGLLAVARRGGQKSYRGAVLVGAESPFHDLGALAGRRGAFVDRQSASGYVMPMAEILRLAAAGAPAVRPQFHGSHRAVCEAVASGWAEFGATFAVVGADGRLRSSAWAELMPERATELRALALSPPIPGDCLAHGPALPESLVGELRRVLLGLGSDPGDAALLEQVFGADGLVGGDVADYEPLRAAQAVVELG